MPKEPVNTELDEQGFYQFSTLTVLSLLVAFYGSICVLILLIRKWASGNQTISQRLSPCRKITSNRPLSRRHRLCVIVIGLGDQGPAER